MSFIKNGSTYINLDQVGRSASTGQLAGRGTPPAFGRDHQVEHKAEVVDMPKVAGRRR